LYVRKSIRIFMSFSLFGVVFPSASRAHLLIANNFRRQSPDTILLIARTCKKYRPSHIHRTHSRPSQRNPFCWCLHHIRFHIVLPTLRCRLRALCAWVFTSQERNPHTLPFTHLS
jgi:hypothetical protein